MEVHVYSRQAVESLPPHEVPHLFLSITTTPEERAKLPTNDHTRGIHRMSFYDLEQVVGDRVTEEQLFSYAQAEEVVQFVADNLKLYPEIARIVVHCDAGLSRSPGMAAAFSKALNGTDETFFSGGRRPNMRVYRKVLNACFETGLLKL